MIRKSERFLSQVYALTDFIVIACSFIFSWWLKFETSFKPTNPPFPFKEYLPWYFVYALIAIAFGYISSFYTSKRKKSFSNEFFHIVQIHIVSGLTLMSILYLYRGFHISRQFMLIFVCFSIVFFTVYRFFVRKILKKFRSKGYNERYILILGAGNLGVDFCNNLKAYPELGFKVVGFLDDYKIQSELGLPILGTLSSLDDILQEMIVDEIIIALPLNAHNKYPEIISVCEKYGVRTLIIPDYFDLLPSRPYFDNFAGIPLINIRGIPLDDLGNQVIKRSFDIAFSIFAIIITSPLLALIAIGIKLTSSGPIIFKQERVGLNRRTFMMYKFRSMKVLPAGVTDTKWTTKNDPRKTKFGSFLRKTSLDELPQFINVLRGDMSVVGPRPERPFFVNQFKEQIPKYMVKHHIRPGLTGWAQASGLRGDTSIQQRINLDIYYIENWSFFFDVKIIFKTIYNGFINKNAY